MSSRLVRIKIKNKFLLAMLAVAIIPVSIIGIISIRLSTDNTVGTSLAFSQYNLDNLNVILTGIVEELKNSCRNVLIDSEIIRILGDGGKSAESPEFLGMRDKLVLDKRLDAIFMHNRYVSSVILMRIHGKDPVWKNIFEKNISTESKLENFSLNSVVSEKWYEDTLKQRGDEVFFKNNVFNKGENYGQNIFASTKLIIDIVNFKPIGIMVINVDKNIFKDLFSESGRVDGNTYLIVNKTDVRNLDIVYQTDELPDIKNFLQKYYADNTPPEGWIVQSVNNSESGWDIVHVVKRSTLIKNTYLIGVTTGLISVIIIFVIIALSIVLSNTINKPLKNLQNAITSVAKGNLEVKEQFEDDEIGLIGNQFKHMVKQNTELKEKIYNLTLKQKEAELKVLQAQINPHFLYNTLDSIYWLAKIRNADDVAQMAESLAEIFKLSLNNGNEITTVGNEIKHISNYLTIQNIRYKNRFEVNMRIDDSLLSCSILKLLLQPIVENAIYHGLEPKVGEGHISISGSRVDDRIVFEIQDDGVGFDVDKTKFTGYALKNVQDRIKLYYGEEYGLGIESVRNLWTKVTVNIPFTN